MSKRQPHKGGKPARGAAQKPKRAVQKKVQEAAGGSPSVPEKAPRPARPACVTVGEQMLTWGDLKEHIEGMDEERLLEPVSAVLAGDDRKLLVEDVRCRGGEGPTLELVTDDEGEDDAEPPDGMAEDSVL